MSALTKPTRSSLKEATKPGFAPGFDIAKLQADLNDVAN